MGPDRETTEVRETQSSDGGSVRREVRQRSEAVPTSILAKRVVWYVAGVIIALLVIRVLLFLFGASNSSGFVQFIYGITWVFAAPFYGIFPQPGYGRFGLDSASLVAIVVYALVAWGLAQLFTLGSRHHNEA